MTATRVDPAETADAPDTGGEPMDNGSAPPVTPPPTPLRVPPVTSPYRGLLTLSLGLTLCIVAVAEAAGAAEAPTWFLAFAIPVLTEYLAEWLAYWRKRGVL